MIFSSRYLILRGGCLCIEVRSNLYPAAALLVEPFEPPFGDYFTLVIFSRVKA
jgi:hypothetical protein